MGVKCTNCGTDNTQDSEFCKKCGTQIIYSEEKPLPTQTIEAPREELTRGTTFADRYEIIEELGKGGMGRVYRVEDSKLKQEIALKLIKPEIAKDKKTIERFRNELKLARNIRHKNVCGMFDLGEKEGAHFITMEYVRGEDLRTLIRRIGQLPIGKSISIARQVCEGLTEAHRQGVVHRDLKSNNIMIDKDGNVRIMDFGIARSLEAKGITGAGVMIGTPEYMSPEQVEGKEVDQRSDIYSLGVILYEMVTGRVPFEGDTPFTIGMKHKGEMPQNPKELNAQISDELNRVILRCLEKEKETRYQSAGEVRSELEDIEKGIPTTERVIPERKPLTSREITVTFGIKKLLVPASVIIAVVIVGLILWQVIPKRQAVPLASSGKPSLAILYFENNTGDESLDHWRKAISELITTDLSQSKYLAVLSGDRLFNILRKENLLEAKSYSSEDLKTVAEQGGVNSVLRGSFTRAGDVIRIDTMLQNVKTGEMLGTERVEATGEEGMFSAVDDLTKKIKANFKLSQNQIANDIDKEIGKITTGSAEALKYYAEARKFHNGGNARQAIPLYEKAIEIDPEFVMAFRGIATAHSNMGRIAKARQYLQKAMELRERASDRQSLQIQGQYYFMSEKTYDKAIDAFEQLLKIYPDDIIGNNGLGIIYADLGQYEEALKYYSVCVRIQPEAWIPYGNLAFAYKNLGHYDKAQEVYEDFIRNVGEEPRAHVSIGYTYLYEEKYDLATAEAEKAYLLDPSSMGSFYLRGDIYHLIGEFHKAEQEYQKILEIGEKSTHLGSRIRLAALSVTQGKFENAEKELQKAGELADELGAVLGKANIQMSIAYLYMQRSNFEQALDKGIEAMQVFSELEMLENQRFNILWKGVTQLEMGLIDEAPWTADNLRDIIQQGMNKRAMRYAHFLDGKIALKQNNMNKAIKFFTDAVSLLLFQSGTYDEHAIYIDALARGYYISGNLDNAKSEFEKITSLTSGRLAYGDAYTKSFYMLGKIYEQRGDSAKAVEHYEKFLDLWKDADPGIAEVEDARERLASINYAK